MKIKIKNKIFIKPENEKEKEIIRKVLHERLTFKDPSAEETNKFSNSFLFTKTIKLYNYKKKDNIFSVPRGRVDAIHLLELAGCKITELKDERQDGRDIKVKANFGFRDEIQKNAFDAYMNSIFNMGILNLSCGLGK